MKYRKRGFWTKENCAIEALKYETRKDFRKNCDSAYSISLKNGWLEDISSHMVLLKKKSGFWIKDTCAIEALKYKTRVDFQNYSGGCYSTALKNGWIEDICFHMKLTHHKNGYWSKQRCYEEALKYNKKIDFINFSNKAYRAAAKRGYIDEICGHMLIIGDRYSRCIYSVEFPDNHVYIGLTYDIDKRFKNHIADVKSNNSSVLKYIKKTGLVPIIKQLTDYIAVSEASKLEEIKKTEYKNKNWIILNRVKCGGIGGNIKKWTKENCATTAAQFSSKKDFRINYSSAYAISQRNKWLDEICIHMS